MEFLQECFEIYCVQIRKSKLKKNCYRFFKSLPVFEIHLFRKYAKITNVCKKQLKKILVVINHKTNLNESGSIT